MTSGPWVLDLAGNGADAAPVAVDLLAANGIEATAVDPREWLVWSLDQESVEYIRDAFRVALASHSLPRAQAMGVESMLEDCEDWLAANFNPERALRED
jgi:hypothetical protein